MSAKVSLALTDMGFKNLRFMLRMMLVNCSGCQRLAGSRWCPPGKIINRESLGFDWNVCACFISFYLPLISWKHISSKDFLKLFISKDNLAWSHTQLLTCCTSFGPSYIFKRIDLDYYLLPINIQTYTFV